MPGFGNQHKSSGGGGPEHDFVAIMAGLGAAFPCANPLYQLTQDAFREIAVRNYGYGPLELFQLLYQGFLHLSVFAITRVAIKWALMAIAMGGFMRLLQVY